MITVQEVHFTTGIAHGHPLTIEVIILGHRQVSRVRKLATTNDTLNDSPIDLEIIQAIKGALTRENTGTRAVWLDIVRECGQIGARKDGGVNLVFDIPDPKLAVRDKHFT